jgi:hypothetical protein
MKCIVFCTEPVSVILQWFSTSEYPTARATDAQAITNNGLAFSCKSDD